MSPTIAQSKADKWHPNFLKQKTVKTKVKRGGMWSATEEKKLKTVVGVQKRPRDECVGEGKRFTFVLTIFCFKKIRMPLVNF